MTPGNPPRSGLWLAAFFLLLIGGTVSAGIYFFGRDYDLQWWRHFCMAVFITSLAVGITLICASSQWWMHR